MKSFGKQMVEEMNERGMLVDVSHLSDGGFWDCIRLSKKPIIASHSNARALCAHPRNLSDEMLCALGECGGVVGLNFYPQFLQSDRSAEVLDIAKHGMHILQKPERILWHWEQISMDLRQGRTGFAGLKRSSVYGML